MACVSQDVVGACLCLVFTFGDAGGAHGQFLRVPISPRLCSHVA